MHQINDLLPPTASRVALNTHPAVNARIRQQTIEAVNIYKDSSDEEDTDRAEQMNKDAVSCRIRELNSEWDTERVLEANAAAVVVASTVLGLKSSRYWFALTGAVGLFLLQHALQGWCPPLPFIRRRGVRTAEEIYNEKTVLKMLRGDFLHTCGDAEELQRIAELQ